MWTSRPRNHLIKDHGYNKDGELLDDKATSPSGSTPSLASSQSISVLDQLQKGLKRKRVTQSAVNGARSAVLQWIMSLECERLFSGAKLTITPQRQRLDANVTKAIELMNAWLRREVIKMGSGDDDI